MQEKNEKLEPIVSSKDDAVAPPISREAWFYLGLSLVWMAVIFAFSHQANSGRITEEYFGDANIPVRKFGHVSEFGVLSLLYLKTLLSFRPLPETLPRNSPALAKYAAAALFLAFLYACSDEWHQAFVPGRSSKFADVLVDTSGMIVALGLALALNWWRSKDSRRSKNS